MNAIASHPSAIKDSVACLALVGSYHEFITRTLTVMSGFASFAPSVKAFICRTTSGIVWAATYPNLFVFVNAPAIKPFK